MSSRDDLNSLADLLNDDDTDDASNDVVSVIEIDENIELDSE